MSGDQTKPRRKTSGAMITVRVLAVLMLLLVGTCSVFLDVHKIAWYAVFPYSYYIEIKTDLTVDGEPVEVTGVARCEWVQRVTPLLPEVRGSGWNRRGGVLAKRLTKGGAVIVMVDPPCRARGNPWGFGGAGKGFWKTTLPLPAPVGQLPIQTLLLDDARHPTRIERSFSKEFFADPRSRVHYIGGTYLPKRRARRPDPRDEVPWLRAERGSSKIWAGFFALVTLRDVWSKEPAVAAALESLTKVTQLTPKLRLPSHGFYLTDGVVRTLYLKNGYWDYRPDAPDPDGLLVLYDRKDPVTGETIPANRSDTIFGAKSRLSIKGRPAGVTPPLYSWPLYEPESKTILWISGDVLAVSADEVRFDRGGNTLSGRLFKF